MPSFSSTYCFFTSLVSLLQYVATVCQLPTFGAQHFDVRQTFSKDLPSQLVLMVNHTGIILADVNTMVTVEAHALGHVLGWAPGPMRISLQLKLPKADKEVCSSYRFSSTCRL